MKTLGLLAIIGSWVLCASLGLAQSSSNAPAPSTPLNNSNNTTPALPNPISGPLLFIVPSSAGTTGDQLARLIGAKITQRSGTAVMVDNRLGAGGLIGIDYVAKAPADGKTFLFSATAFSTLAALRSDLPYDPIKNFSSVVLLGTSPLVFVVNNAFPAQTLKEFVEYVGKQRPNSINYASPGIGSVHHLSMEMFLQHTGLQMVHVPYKASANSLTDIVAGHVQSGFVVLQTAAPLVQNGKMRILAVISNTRSAQFPSSPTFIESGFNLPAINAWFGISAPANVPSSTLLALNAEINQILKLPDVQLAMQKMGVNPAGGSPDKLETLVKNEIKIWTQVVKKADITLE
jgi:tripartite-type tricarboxylate transporter receptor subunit TctC